MTRTDTAITTTCIIGAAAATPMAAPWIMTLQAAALGSVLLLAGIYRVTKY